MLNIHHLTWVPAGRRLSGRVSSRYQSRSGSVLEPGQDRVSPQHVPHSWWDQSCSHEGSASVCLFVVAVTDSLKHQAVEVT